MILILSVPLRKGYILELDILRLLIRAGVVRVPALLVEILPYSP